MIYYPEGSVAQCGVFAKGRLVVSQCENHSACLSYEGLVEAVAKCTGGEDGLRQLDKLKHILGDVPLQ
jgi:hypothetical protein